MSLNWLNEKVVGLFIGFSIVGVVVRLSPISDIARVATRIEWAFTGWPGKEALQGGVSGRRAQRAGIGWGRSPLPVVGPLLARLRRKN